MSSIAYSCVVFFKLIQHLISTLNNHQLLPQDFADSLASHLSATMTSALLALVMTRMFFFSSVECLVPSEWPESWEKSAEAYCFSDGTYTLPHSAANVTNVTIQWNKRIKLDYYYWIPYILVGQAVILKAPDFFWHFLCDLHPKRPAATLKAFAFIVGSQEMTKGEKDSGEKLFEMTHCVQRRIWSDRVAEHLLSRNCLINFESWHLFAYYMFFKVLRLMALILSLLYLRASFGLESMMFGATMARNSFHGLPWEHTDLFPRWAYCDVHMRVVDQWNTRTTQCALPINMMIEKALLFLWFWIVCCAAVLLYSAAAWSIRMLTSRRRLFSKSFISISESLTVQERRRALADWKLVDELSAIDRVFMLRLVDDRLGLATVYLAMDSMLLRLVGTDRK